MWGQVWKFTIPIIWLAYGLSRRRRCRGAREGEGGGGRINWGGRTQRLDKAPTVKNPKTSTQVAAKAG